MPSWQEGKRLLPAFSGAHLMPASLRRTWRDARGCSFRHRRSGAWPCILRASGQLDREAGPLAHCTLNENAPAVGLDDLLGNSEAEPRGAWLAHRLRSTGHSARTDDPEFAAEFPVPCRSTFNRTLPSCASHAEIDIVATARRIAQPIGNQVGEHPGELYRIARIVGMTLASGLSASRTAFAQPEARMFWHDAVTNSPMSITDARIVIAPSFATREIQQIVGETAHAADILVDGREQFALLGIEILLAAFEQFRRQRERSKWGLELVRERRDQIRARPILVAQVGDVLQDQDCAERLRRRPAAAAPASRRRCDRGRERADRLRPAGVSSG